MGQRSWDSLLEGGWGRAALGTHQQCVQLCRVVGEEPGGLLAQLADLGDLPGKSTLTITRPRTWHPVSQQPSGDPKADRCAHIRPSLGHKVPANASVTRAKCSPDLLENDDPCPLPPLHPPFLTCVLAIQRLPPTQGPHTPIRKVNIRDSGLGQEEC